MSEKTAVRTREKWVDDVKVIACILVVLGHFFQSMTKANILPENNLYGWFNTTIYYFHVPLFFICSGYLYQKYSKVNSVDGWCKNVAKKALALGVPYLTFSTATWLLKTMFADSVNFHCQTAEDYIRVLDAFFDSEDKLTTMSIAEKKFVKSNFDKEISYERYRDSLLHIAGKK